MGMATTANKAATANHIHKEPANHCIFSGRVIIQAAPISTLTTPPMTIRR